MINSEDNEDQGNARSDLPVTRQMSASDSGRWDAFADPVHEAVLRKREDEELHILLSAHILHVIGIDARQRGARSQSASHPRGGTRG